MQTIFRWEQKIVSFFISLLLLSFGKYRFFLSYSQRSFLSCCVYFWPKMQQTKMLVMCQRFDGLFLFELVWQFQFQFRQNMIKVGSKSGLRLLTCSSNITLSLPSYTGSVLNRELNFCNGCLSLLYFCFWPWIALQRKKTGIQGQKLYIEIPSNL